MVWEAKGNAPRGADRLLAGYVDDQLRSIAQEFRRQESDGFSVDLNVTGMTTTETITAHFTIWGPLVNLRLSGSATGTSNATTMTIDDFPIHMMPTKSSQLLPWRIVDNGVLSWGLMQIGAQDSGPPPLIEFSPGQSLLVPFTASGAKTLGTGSGTYLKI